MTTHLVYGMGDGLLCVHLPAIYSVGNAIQDLLHCLLLLEDYKCKAPGGGEDILLLRATRHHTHTRDQRQWDFVSVVNGYWSMLTLICQSPGQTSD